MGVQVEFPTLRKKRLLMMSSLEIPNKGSKGIDHDSWQWGAFENVTIDETVMNPTRLTVKCDDASTVLANDTPDGSSNQLVSPSTSGSSPASPSSPRSGCVDPFRASVTHRRLLKQRLHGKDPSSMAFSCSSEFRSPRWYSGRWSGRESSFGESSSSMRRGNRLCKCAAGLTADVAVVCCCPFSLLHLLAIAFVKVPAAVVSKTVAKCKRKVAARRKRTVAVHEEEEESIPATSCPPSRCSSYEAGEVQTWAPALAFGDQKMWRECFDSPDTGLSIAGESRKDKA